MDFYYKLLDKLALIASRTENEVGRNIMIKEYAIEKYHVVSKISVEDCMKKAIDKIKKQKIIFWDTYPTISRGEDIACDTIFYICYWRAALEKLNEVHS